MDIESNMITEIRNVRERGREGVKGSESCLVED